MKSLPRNKMVDQPESKLTGQPRQLRIRAFRAVDDQDSCQKFLEGHRNVLLNHGVKNVVSALPEWTEDENVWVVIVESMDGERTFGGARVHKSSPTNKLPIQDAISYLDPKIDDFVEENRHIGLGEICGLWNSVEVAGMGVGSVMLIRAGISLANEIGVKGMFALCSPYTYKMAASFGFFPLREIGDKGKFPYPTDKLIATVTYQEDANELIGARSEQKEIILDLQKEPNQKKIETARNGISVQVSYELKL